MDTGLTISNKVLMQFALIIANKYHYPRQMIFFYTEREWGMCEHLKNGFKRKDLIYGDIHTQTAIGVASASHEFCEWVLRHTIISFHYQKGIDQL